MGAPGLAFETWDPPRRCRRTKLENSNFEKALARFRRPVPQTSLKEVAILIR